jgi:hypothetical protein
MNYISKILQEIPFFRHFSDEEIAYLHKIGRISNVRQGQTFDLKKSSSLNVIIDGVFEIEAHGKKEIVYLSPGSFFGDLPFSHRGQHGTIRAVVDSTIMMINEEGLYRLFLTTRKGLRGYIRSIKKLGLEITEIGKKYFENQSRVITIYSPWKECGKTFLSSLIGTALSPKGKTIIFDLSYEGKSLFDFFDKKITSPLSQKQVNSPSIEEMIHERIEEVDENLHLINISFGSKVKVDPSILSPILFILSKEYRYFVFDLSDSDTGLRNVALELSDTLFCVVKSVKNLPDLYPVLDENLKEGQRLFYIINEHSAGTQHNFQGGLILEKYNLENGKSTRENLLNIREKPVIEELAGLIADNKRGVVFESSLLEASCYSGFLNALDDSDIPFHLMLSSSFGYIVMLLNIVSETREEFNSRITDFFSEERIKSFLDIVFPDKFMFKKNSVAKFANEICRERRVENYRTIPAAMLCESGTDDSRLFTTGNLRDIVEASIVSYPVFESAEIHSKPYNSGYPFYRVRVEELFRTDIDELYYVTVNNREKMEFRSERVLKFYRDYIDLEYRNQFHKKKSVLADGNIVIDVSAKELKIEKIIEESESVSTKLIGELK